MRTPRLLMIAMTLVLSVSTLFAATATQCYTGACAGGGAWVTCITYDTGSGEVVTREGTMCGGTHWVDHCRISIVETNPGETSDYYISGSGWWIRFNSDASGAITSMWGKNAAGFYWVASTDQGNLL